MQTGKVRILVLCTHNSARSQMAEAFLRQYLPHSAEVFSAGTHPTPIHPLTHLVMQEVGLDLSHHYAKTIEALPNAEWDYVITVCDNARESCPYLPARRSLHWSFPDPSETNTLEAFRRVRDQIQTWAQTFAQKLREEQSFPTS